MKNNTMKNDNDKLNGIIANLRSCDDYHGNIEHDTFDNAIEAIEQLRKERDEALSQRDAARREYCELKDPSPQWLAQEKGWDCFENCTQVGGEWLVNERKA